MSTALKMFEPVHRGSKIVGFTQDFGNWTKAWVCPGVTVQVLAPKFLCRSDAERAINEWMERRG